MRIDLQDIIVISVEKIHTGYSVISSENPNDKLAEGIILLEKGEYRCRACDILITLCRKFNNNSEYPSKDIIS